ncbi:MAG: WYL domain-containing protein [Planctomycetota bacterium]|nr:WYL domain-containing protein [Planctomycetota bacterium]MDA1179630.1 WYL domain-containing protein [Planctomycetota bacterium]
MARNEQLIRQHRILQILERFRFGVPLEELRDMLVEELGLSALHTRSVRRDLAALQASGIDVDVEDNPRGRVWKLGPRFKGTHTIAASATELIALSLGRDLLLPLVGTPFWMGIESFWTKVQESLPDGVWSHYQRYRRVLHVLGLPTKSYADQQGTLKTINRAILEHRVLEAEYQSLQEAKPSLRQLAPYGLVLYQGSLYVVAENYPQVPQAKMKHFKLDRFRKATALDNWFDPQADFSLEEYLQGSMSIFSGGQPQKFCIRVSAYALPWLLEDPWHKEQKVDPLDDGGGIITLHAAHPLEILPRVLALGSQAEVLEPQSCRETLARIARDMLEKYAPTGSESLNQTLTK